MAEDGHRVTLEPPYYAVIFTSLRSGEDDEDYAVMSARMATLAAGMSGFLGMDSARDSLGITVSYWSDLDAIKAWKAHADHLFAQREGRRAWYDAYRVRIALVERDHGFTRAGHAPL